MLVCSLIAIAVLSVRIPSNERFANVATVESCVVPARLDDELRLSEPIDVSNDASESIRPIPVATPTDRLAERLLDRLEQLDDRLTILARGFNSLSAHVDEALRNLPLTSEMPLDVVADNPHAARLATITDRLLALETVAARTEQMLILQSDRLSEFSAEQTTLLSRLETGSRLAQDAVRDAGAAKPLIDSTVIECKSEDEAPGQLRLRVRDAELRDVLAKLAGRGRFLLAISPHVSARMNGEWSGQSERELFRTLLHEQGYRGYWIDNVAVVVTVEESLLSDLPAYVR